MIARGSTGYGPLARRLAGLEEQIDTQRAALAHIGAPPDIRDMPGWLQGLDDTSLDRVISLLGADQPRAQRQQLYAWAAGLSDADLARACAGELLP